MPQGRETSIQLVQRNHLAYRYAYVRSMDSRESDDAGQDYLAIRDTPTQLTFALCDGVSQSFMGDLGSRLVGDALLAWLEHPPVPLGDQSAVHAALSERLGALAGEADRQVQQMPLPAGLPAMLTDVLNQKRASGTESTLVAGALDTRADRLLLVWMGDSRIRLWDAGGECTSEALGDAFHTRERWSSSRGLVGSLHTFCAPLGAFRRLAIYTDGLALLDAAHMLARPPSNCELSERIIEASCSPTSDDIAYLEIALRPERLPDDRPGPLALPGRRPRRPEPTIGYAANQVAALPRPPREIRVARRGAVISATWEQVPGAEAYEVSLGSARDIWRARQNGFQVEQRQIPRGAPGLRVRSVGYGGAGAWSEPAPLPVPALSPLAIQLIVASMALVLLFSCAHAAIWIARTDIIAQPTATATQAQQQTPQARRPDGGR